MDVTASKMLTGTKRIEEAGRAIISEKKRTIASA